MISTARSFPKPSSGSLLSFAGVKRQLLDICVSGSAGTPSATPFGRLRIAGSADSSDRPRCLGFSAFSFLPNI
ncbi:hypothetical protein SJ05684_c14400 [Sinorhizobium sojae CCBAU 05684]|uniref:Uncharacterized protein n=1 Tax=Sinorhizobium sojae CCBAU 05684 TaxID=716928 RepID=A0A249PAE7_9HYPH|nr:hypothetical protein SJ05684_c14400 [Sinorhizobium sojae CCBAU 05684]